MTSVSKTVSIDKLADILNKYSNTCSTIKMKAVDVNDIHTIENSDKDPKFKIGNKEYFAEAYFPNWSEEVFVIKKVKNTVPWAYVVSDLNGEKIIRTFYEKELQKTN